MKVLLGPVLSFIFINSAYSCGNNLLIYRETSGGISIGADGISFGGSSKRYVEVPVQVDHHRGCWKQKDQFSVAIDENSEYQKGKITFSLPRSEFKNIPSARHEIFVRRNAFDGESEFENIQISLLSLTCAAEGVLSVETFESSLGTLLSHRPLNLTQGLSFSLQRAPRYLMSAFHVEGPDELDLPNIYLPSVYLGTTLQIGAFDLSHDYTTASVMPYACSKWFKEKMQSFHIENLSNRKSNGFSLKKKGWKKKRLEFEWKL